jgi:hypothetical protein
MTQKSNDLSIDLSLKLEHALRSGAFADRDLISARTKLSRAPPDAGSKRARGGAVSPA